MDIEKKLDCKETEDTGLLGENGNVKQDKFCANDARTYMPAEPNRFCQKQTRLELIIIGAVITYLIIYARGMFPWEWSLWKTMMASLITYPFIALPAFVIFKMQGGKVRRLFTWKLSEVLTGIAIFAACYGGLWIYFGVTGQSHPLCGYLYNQFVQFTLYYFVLYIIVGITEELIFRICLQDNLLVVFGKAKCVVPLITAMVFGAYHLINGTMYQARITFVMGLIFGYTRMYCKKCSFTSLVIGHFLYDFVIGIVGMILCSVY